MNEAMTVRAGEFPGLLPGLHCEYRLGMTWEGLMRQQDRLREAAVAEYLREMLGVKVMGEWREVGRN